MDETSGGGSPVYRYETRAAEPRPAVGDEELINAMAAHMRSCFGQAGLVIHELVSGPVHVDVFHAEPSDSLLFHTLVTCGMSELPMPAPPEVPEGRYAELALQGTQALFDLLDEAGVSELLEPDRSSAVRRRRRFLGWR